MVSGLRKIKRSTASLLAADSGIANTEDMKATWKETSMWLAITQPSCRYDLWFKAPLLAGSVGAPGVGYFTCLSRDAAYFMAPVLFGIRELYPCQLCRAMTCVNCHFVSDDCVSNGAFGEPFN